MDDVLDRRKRIKAVLDNENDERKKEVIARILDLIGLNGQYLYGDIFEGFDELRSDKQFIMKCINLNPEIYTYISQELKEDESVLMALASSPLYYNDYSIGDYGCYVHNPLYLIIQEYQIENDKKNRLIREKVRQKEIDLLNEYYESKGITIKDIKKYWDQRALNKKIENEDKIRLIEEQRPDFSKELEEFKKLTEEFEHVALDKYVEKYDKDFYISDKNLIIASLKSELDSYEYCNEMERKYKPIIKYDGLEFLNKILEGKFSLKRLSSLEYALPKLFEDRFFTKEIENIIQNWKDKQIALKKENNENER